MNEEGAHRAWNHPSDTGPCKNSGCGFKIFQLLLSAVFPPLNGVQVGLWNLEETSFNTGFILKKTLAEEKGRIN